MCKTIRLKNFVGGMVIRYECTTYSWIAKSPGPAISGHVGTNVPRVVSRHWSVWSAMVYGIRYISFPS
ncbi:hypothetical protein Mapa_016661 [Marchantia paleacea]|nr:hypothetical protein Mapa_016661 [Marchantia paleacea]